jgi:nucleotide-binding universal stress UspA family protein
MFQRVLVPVDGSELCTAAIDQVARVADAGARILLVEVIDSAARILAQTTPAGFAWHDAGISGDLLSDVITAQRAAADAHLDAARARLHAAGLSQVETRTMEGIPGPAIVELAQLIEADAVVMATHGRSGLRRTVLGSVADYVLRHLHGIPVVLIRPADAAAAAPEPSFAAAR